MQGQQPVIRQGDQQILQQPTSIVIKMTDGIQQITPVGKFVHFLLCFFFIYLLMQLIGKFRWKNFVQSVVN